MQIYKKAINLSLIFLFIICVVDIFTTEGISFSARSAKEFGIVLLCNGETGKINKIITNVKLINFL